MIGAMPAIAVRGKGKTDGSIGFMSRPHKLSLHFRPPLTHQVTPTPSPTNSPLGTCPSHRDKAHHRFARNFLSKRCIFQLSVLAPLVGAILLFIGLIQLTPGAEASPYGVPLIIAGSAALLVGLLVILMRVYFTWELNRLHMRRNNVPQIKVNEPNDPDVEKVGGGCPPNNATAISNSVNGARKSSIVTCLGGNNVTTTTTTTMIMGEEDNKKKISSSPLLPLSPKAPPRCHKSKDREKQEMMKENGKASEESVKLLKDSVGSEKDKEKKDKEALKKV